MQIHQIESLSAVATHGSFSKAATALGRNQPAISKAVQALEVELGIVLLDRSSGGARLTEAGEKVMQRAKAVLTGLDLMKEEAALIQGAKGGSVRIGVSPAAATTLIPNACKRLLAQFPQVELDIVPTLYPAAGTLLRDGSLDVVLGPVPNRLDHDLKVERLFDMPPAIVTHCEHRLRGATSLKELKKEHWIVHGPTKGPSSLFEAAFTERDFGLPSARVRCHSISATLALLKPLDAFCVLSRPVYNYYASRDAITAVPIKSHFNAFQMCMLTLRNWVPTPAQLCLMDCIRLTSAKDADTRIEAD